MNVSPTERVVSVLAGLALFGLAVRQRNAATPFLFLLGGMATGRGVTGQCALYRQVGFDSAHRRESGVAGNSGIRVEEAIEVHRPPAQVFAYWRNLENLPRFLPHLRSVEQAKNGLSHWTVEGPAGTTVEWDAEIINEHPGELLAWQSLPGAQVRNAGSVRFQPIEDGQGTRVTVLLQYQPPAGQLGVAVASLLGRAPDRQLAGDLDRFRALIESVPA